jgi:hypothetical protein
MKRAKIPWLSRVSYRYQILPHRGWQTSPESVAAFKRNGWQPSTGMGGNLGPEYSHTDKGLITCWENGRELGKKKPELAEQAKNGELPVSGWKGGVEKKLKKKEKVGTHYYLAEWQGLRGENLNIDLSEETEFICSKTGMKVIYTSDARKYENA